MTEHETVSAEAAMRQLISMVRMTGLLPLAPVPDERDWSAVIAYVAAAFNGYAQRAAAQPLLQQQLSEEHLKMSREVRDLHDQIREVQQQRSVLVATLAELRANPDVATWHKRALMAEAALEGAQSASVLAFDWMEKVRSYMEGKIDASYEISSKQSAASSLRWDLERQIKATGDGTGES